MRSHSRAIHNNKAIPSRIIRSRVTDNSKATRSKVMHNSKVMPNSKAIRNRVMDNHLPGKTCRPGNCP